MKPEVAQGMMFLLENAQVLHKHYKDIAPKYRNKEHHHLISLESQFLPEVDQKIEGAKYSILGNRIHLLQVRNN